MANVPVFPQTPKTGLASINNAAASTPQTIYTGGANGTKLVALTAGSTDTSARDVQVSLVRSGVSYILGTATIPAGAGNSGTVPAVDLFNAGIMPGLPRDSDGMHYVFLKDNSEAISVTALTTVTAAKLIYFTTHGADF